MALGLDFLGQADGGVDDRHAADRDAALQLAEREQGGCRRCDEGVEQGEDVADEDAAVVGPGRVGSAVDQAAADALSDLGTGQTLVGVSAHRLPLLARCETPAVSVVSAREDAMLYRAYTPADRDACLAVFDGNAD